MKTVAELVDDLFKTYRKPNGREYTYAEIAHALNGSIDPSLISKLRYGHIKNPGRETLLALCTFFKIQPTYFFPELQPPDSTSTPPTVDSLSIVLARSSQLSPAILQKLQELIQALEEEKDKERES